MKLNPQQDKAAQTHFGPLMLLAGAGTGKTRVIVSRIVSMVNAGIGPHNICAVTFTNKAAQEMRERIAKELPRQVDKIFVGTFHRFCLDALRHNPQIFSLRKNFNLLGASDQIEMVRRILEDKGFLKNFSPRDIHAQISLLKNYLVSPHELTYEKIRNLSIKGVIDLAITPSVYKAYEEQLSLNNAVDFDDCIMKLTLALKTDAEAKEKIRQQYRFFLVDEFQDTNLAQFELIKALVQPENHICVVGDDDQSIYSFRGAMYETIRLFEQTFSGCQVIKLEQNYRSCDGILKAANAVIKNNSLRTDKTLWSDALSKEPIYLKEAQDPEDEARWLATKIESMLLKGRNLKDIAILYRANSLSRGLELALKEKNLKYRIFGGKSFLDLKEIRDVLSYLRLISDHHDNFAFYRAVAVPPKGVGLKTLAKLIEEANSKSMSLFDLVRRSEEKTSSKLKNFVHEIYELAQKDILNRQDFEDLSREILERFAFKEYMKSSAKAPKFFEKKINNINSFIRWFASFGERKFLGKWDLKVLIESILLSESIENEKDDDNYISLMTIHSAKGLEFPVVFLAGLEEGTLPHKNSLIDEMVDEERRLFYVALTRARESLFLSYARSRRTAFSRSAQEPSRFLAEIPDEWIKNVDSLPEAAETKKETLNFLKRLRSDLAGESFFS